MPTPPAARRVPALRCRIRRRRGGAERPLPARPPPSAARACAPRSRCRCREGARRAPGPPRGPTRDAAGRGRGGQTEGRAGVPGPPQRLTSPAPRHPRHPASARRPSSLQVTPRADLERSSHSRSGEQASGSRPGTFGGPLGPARAAAVAQRGQERDPSRMLEDPGREEEDPGPTALGHGGRNSRAGASRARRFSCQDCGSL